MSVSAEASTASGLDLETQAINEILTDVKRGAERAKEHGALGWQKKPGPGPNKAFLRNMLLSTLRPSCSTLHQAHKVDVDLCHHDTSELSKHCNIGGSPQAHCHINHSASSKHGKTSSIQHIRDLPCGQDGHLPNRHASVNATDTCSFPGTSSGWLHTSERCCNCSFNSSSDMLLSSKSTVYHSRLRASGDSAMPAKDEFSIHERDNLKKSSRLLKRIGRSEPRHSAKQHYCFDGRKKPRLA